MKMKKSQFREDTATYIQMIHLLNEYNPGWKIILIGVLLEGIFPFIAIFLSSMLLDALYAGRSMQEMALLVLAGTGASFVTAILRHLVTKKKNIMWWGMQHRMTEPIMTKTMQMDYEQIGDERVRTLRARQDEYRKREKDVFERFLTQLEILLTAAVRMVAAIITIGSFFAKQFSKDGNTSFEYQSDENTYVATNVELDTENDKFLINNIKKTKQGYEVEIVEYLEDYSNEPEDVIIDEENKTAEETEFDISIKNVNEETVFSVKNTEGPTEIIDKVKSNIDKFTKKKLTIEKGENDKLYVTKVE